MAEALPVTSVLRGVDEIATIGQDARKISYQAAKFTDKLLSLKAPLTALQECSDLCPVEVLVNTNEMLGESKAFLEEYSKSSRETRTAQRRQYAKAFANLFARAEDSLEALNLVVRTAEDHAMAGDRGALMAMSRGVSGWPAGSGWGSKTKLTTWWGVEVENARVTALDLGNRGNDHKLTGAIPGEVGNMTSLTALVLNYNDFTDVIPRELGQLSVLKELHLNNCKLTGSIPAELGALSSVVTIDLSFNGLEGPIPTELGNLTTLEVLNLSNNRLSDSIPPGLRGLKSLKSINVSWNMLTVVPPIMFGGSAKRLKKRLPAGCHVSLYPQGVRAQL